ncbi:MAG: HlyC/CorC family transporter [Verrucomicrobia bacterium]|nr:HlyC/CorC family transporter [Verrucomicrobiota bacterium]
MSLESGLPFLFFLGFCFVLGVKTGLEHLDPHFLEEKFSKSRVLFFFYRLVLKLFPKERLTPLLNFLRLTILITSLGYAITATAYFATFQFFFKDPHATSLDYLSILLFLSVLIGIALLSYIVFYLFSKHFPLLSLQLFSLPATFFLLLLFPVIYSLVWVEKKLGIEKDSKDKEPSEHLKNRLLGLLKELEIQEYLDPRDKNLLHSLAQFKDLVCREIMIPRVDVMALSKTATLHEAITAFVAEGYSRIPVYQDSIDHIVGVILYKDAMEYAFMTLDNEPEKIHNTSIESLISPIIYAPENKKIQDLFQEMRNLKIHVAILVNEYGVTEGLVTIEDILEELIGTEILDEHDVESNGFITEAKDNGWIVDAKMSIVDAEKSLKIAFPHNPEYETIGGFIQWKTGLIPAAETVIYSQNFKIEILESDKRQIFKVKITPDTPLLTPDH